MDCARSVRGACASTDPNVAIVERQMTPNPPRIARIILAVYVVFKAQLQSGMVDTTKRRSSEIAGPQVWRPLFWVLGIERQECSKGVRGLMNTDTE